MKVIPALLATDANSLFALLCKAEQITDYVQIDVMDGIFVPTRSFPPETISELPLSVSFELHLMVQYPHLLMNTIAHPRLRRVICHAEADVDHGAFAAELTAKGLDAGLAVNSETPLPALLPLVAPFALLLFLTVHPGRYGSPFLPDVLEKVARARELFPDKEIAVDGGVSLDNLAAIAAAGVDTVCVGSRIFAGGDAAAKFHAFVAWSAAVSGRVTKAAKGEK